MSVAEMSKYICVNLDDLIPYSANFRWREVLLLRKWNMYVYPTEAQYSNLIKTIQKVESIRGRFGGKIIEIISGLRPEAYNTFIGGAHLSGHMTGEAIDFKILTVDCDKVREDLKRELDRLAIRMENKPGSSWVHIDVKPVQIGGSRYFQPLSL